MSSKLNKEIPLQVIVDTVSNEKGVSEEVIFQALEAALVMATKKIYGSDIEVRVHIYREKGSGKAGTYDTFRIWTVVPDPSDDAELEFPLKDLPLSEARKKKSHSEVGDIIEEPMESIEFGRIAAQTAKQVIIQKVREAERALIVKEFEAKIDQLITGVVKKTTRDSVILDLGGNAEGLLRKEDMLPREAFRPGDRVRAYLSDVSMESRGPQLTLSRTAANMLVELFKLEVPEVGEGIIEVKSAARDPGIRAKIAVKTNDGRIDPVGACVGMRGARVQAVSNELGGERVDIILYDDNPAQFVMNAMAPAEVVSIVVDEDARTMDIAVSEEHLSQAIGRNGQNVRLASLLTGWELNVISASEASEQRDQEQARLQGMFMEQLGIESEVADILIEEGFTSLEEVAYVPIHELAEIEDLDEATINELRNRAKDSLLTQALVLEEKLGKGPQPDATLLEVEGLDDKMAASLAKQGIINREDLAELAVDDLIEKIVVTQEQAAKIIMAARAHWFEAD